MYYIHTHSGHIFDFTKPYDSVICIEDIAAGLCRACRYGGQLPDGVFYSVAEHSVLCVEEAEKDGITDPRLLLTLLLHDASEAYCGDVVKPLKNLLDQAYVSVEKNVEDCIGKHFGVDFIYHHDFIKKYDIEMFNAERQYIFNMKIDGARIIKPQFKLYNFDLAKQMFMDKYKELVNDKVESNCCSSKW